MLLNRAYLGDYSSVLFDLFTHILFIVVRVFR